MLDKVVGFYYLYANDTLFRIMKGHIFNIDNGYLEGLCRGFKNGILKQVKTYLIIFKRKKNQG